MNNRVQDCCNVFWNSQMHRVSSTMESINRVTRQSALETIHRQKGDDHRLSRSAHMPELRTRARMATAAAASDAAAAARQGARPGRDSPNSVAKGRSHGRTNRSGSSGARTQSSRSVAEYGGGAGDNDVSRSNSLRQRHLSAAPGSNASPRSSSRMTSPSAGALRRRTSPNVSAQGLATGGVR